MNNNLHFDYLLHIIHLRNRYRYLQDLEQDFCEDSPNLVKLAIKYEKYGVLQSIDFLSRYHVNLEQYRKENEKL